jgi:hypothetical protein
MWKLRGGNVGMLTVVQAKIVYTHFEETVDLLDGEYTFGEQRKQE